jgi:thioredoxin 2
MSESLVVCAKCGAINRLPPERPALKANCARCGTPVFAGHPADVTGENFDRQVSRGTLPLLVDVWAPWCGPCLAMAPAFVEAAGELEPELRLLKLNSDAAQDVAARLGIRSIPTMILFQAGREKARISGALSAAQIVRWAKEQVG